MQSCKQADFTAASTDGSYLPPVSLIIDSTDFCSALICLGITSNPIPLDIIRTGACALPRLHRGHFQPYDSRLPGCRLPGFRCARRTSFY